jgi:predicted anti-sigma-YlaC factor YlaD
MDCDSIRIAVSASLDGADPGVPAGVIRAHLEGCAACRDWRERQHMLTRMARLGGHALGHDLAPRVLAALPEGERARPARAGRLTRSPRAEWIRVALVLVAAAQFAITVPLLIMGHDLDAGAHAAHELGSFDLSLAIAFAVGAVKPRLSAGLAWPCCIAALGLAVTAVLGILAGQTIGADEAQHLIAIAGALLLLRQARTGSTGTAGTGAGTGVPAAAAHDHLTADFGTEPPAGQAHSPVAQREDVA